MLYSKGWRPISEMFEKAQRYSWGLHKRDFFQPPSGDQQSDIEYNDWRSSASRSEAAEIVWRYLGGVSEIAVLAPSGEAIPAMVKVVDWSDPNSVFGDYVNLEFGTLGTGNGGWLEILELNENEQEETPLSKFRKMFGHFLFQPVLVKESDFNIFLETLGTTYVNRTTPGHREIAEQIVDAFDKGQPITKAWVKTHLAGDMKVAEFQATWEMARARRPEISKPGPRTA